MKKLATIAAFVIVLALAGTLIVVEGSVEPTGVTGVSSGTQTGPPPATCKTATVAIKLRAEDDPELRQAKRELLDSAPYAYSRVLINVQRQGEVLYGILRGVSCNTPTAVPGLRGPGTYPAASAAERTKVR